MRNSSNSNDVFSCLVFSLLNCYTHTRHSTRVTKPNYTCYQTKLVKRPLPVHMGCNTFASRVATSDKRGINVSHVCDIVSMLGQCQSARRDGNTLSSVVKTSEFSDILLFFA